jgi:uncharacterized protein
MEKLIFYILIAVLIYWIIKSRQPKQKERESLPESIEDMVSCAHCGVYLSQSDAVSNHNKFFCSHEHCHLYFNASS